MGWKHHTFPVWLLRTTGTNERTAFVHLFICSLVRSFVDRISGFLRRVWGIRSQEGRRGAWASLVALFQSSVACVEDILSNLSRHVGCEWSLLVGGSWSSHGLLPGCCENVHFASKTCKTCHWVDAERWNGVCDRVACLPTRLATGYSITLFLILFGISCCSNHAVYLDALWRIQVFLLFFLGQCSCL